MVIVTIYYGPYEAYGTIRHRIQRVNGLFAFLKRMGYVVQIIPSDLLNRLTIEMYGTEIFRADIRNFKFNIPCTNDVICERAVESIEEARIRLASDDVYHQTILNLNEANRLWSTAGLYSSSVLLNFNKSVTASHYDSPSEKKLQNGCLVSNRDYHNDLE